VLFYVHLHEQMQVIGRLNVLCGTPIFVAGNDALWAATLTVWLFRGVLLCLHETR